MLCLDGGLHSYMLLAYVASPAMRQAGAPLDSAMLMSYRLYLHSKFYLYFLYFSQDIRIYWLTHQNFMPSSSLIRGR